MNVCTSCECVDNFIIGMYNKLVNTSLTIKNTCSLFGHNEIEVTNELKQNSTNLFIDMIENKNVNCFYFGGLGQFDDLCWQIITGLKTRYKDIVRVFCLADPRHQRLSKRPKWLKNEDYEEIVYLELDFDYWYTRIYYRNCEIVNRSDYVVFYVNHTKGSGAYKAMQYAIKHKKSIINVCESFNK